MREGAKKYNLMSGAFPISTAQFESLGIKSIQNTIISKSVSGKKLARQIDGQRWAFTARIITAKRSDVYGQLMAFIIKQRSSKENFTIVPPEIEDARGTASQEHQLEQLVLEIHLLH
jgi:hypothetical protein